LALPDWLDDAQLELVRDYLNAPRGARARYFARALERCDAAGGRVLEFNHGGATDVVAGVMPLDWDSRHFGLECARLGPLCIPAGMPNATRLAVVGEVIDAALAWCRQAKISLLARRMVGARSDEMQLFEQRGFREVDNIITLTAPAEILNLERAVRPAAERDRDALLAIAREAFPHSRFLAEPAFDSEKARAVYVRWLETLLSGETSGDKSGADGVVLVAELDGRPAGFAAIRRDRELDSLAGAPMAALEMFAVAEEGRGQGLGGALLAAARDWAARSGAETVEASTWQQAGAALASYRRAGFEVRETLFTMHARIS
jgi:GNAT superfamily N-acetyltransferase